MPVAFVFESVQVDQSGYDGLMQAIGRESLDAPLPAGCIAHMAGPKAEGGYRAVDVWESEQAANAFYGSEQFGPVMSAAPSMGISNTPWLLHRLEVGQTIKHTS
jgi:hypothetical protein